VGSSNLVSPVQR